MSLLIDMGIAGFLFFTGLGLYFYLLAKAEALKYKKEALK